MFNLLVLADCELNVSSENFSSNSSPLSFSNATQFDHFLVYLNESSFEKDTLLHNLEGGFILATCHEIKSYNFQTQFTKTFLDISFLEESLIIDNIFLISPNHIAVSFITKTKNEKNVCFDSIHVYNIHTNELVGKFEGKNSVGIKILQCNTCKKYINHNYRFFVSGVYLLVVYENNEIDILYVEMRNELKTGTNCNELNFNKILIIPSTENKVVKSVEFVKNIESEFKFEYIIVIYDDFSLLRIKLFERMAETNRNSERFTSMTYYKMENNDQKKLQFVSPLSLRLIESVKDIFLMLDKTGNVLIYCFKQIRGGESCLCFEIEGNYDNAVITKNEEGHCDIAASSKGFLDFFSIFYELEQGSDYSITYHSEENKISAVRRGYYPARLFQFTAHNDYITNMLFNCIVLL